MREGPDCKCCTPASQESLDGRFGPFETVETVETVEATHIDDGFVRKPDMCGRSKMRAAAKPQLSNASQRRAAMQGKLKHTFAVARMALATLVAAMGVCTGRTFGGCHRLPRSARYIPEPHNSGRFHRNAPGNIQFGTPVI